MFTRQFSGFVHLAVTTFVTANPLNVIMQRRTATNVFPTLLTTSSLSKAMTIAAGATFTPAQPYTRFDRGSGACKGQSSCTLDQVYFEDVCENAITKQASASAISRINYGGAKNADDKIVQHNGAGTVIINSFYAENFGKIYRSCGNQYKRHVQINDLGAVNGDVVAGINTNYGDTATIRTTQVDDVDDICIKYTGNDDGGEPVETGSHCVEPVSKMAKFWGARRADG
ncbi:Pectate lyase H [Mycena venus]|uniref:Pectate lyase n=1 Tax=Mycena venus TaxID=2733690 RepID=A0A8H6YQR3_9AGAR|nr:Pectate lyase H [Mycena venus]